MGVLYVSLFCVIFISMGKMIVGRTGGHTGGCFGPGGARFFCGVWGLVLFFFLSLPLEAQNFRAFTFLRVIETVHFEIIFPAESEPTAQALAEFADATYERVSGLLGITLNRRIPVVITPHTDLFNGYMNLMPYPHIVLFDTPMDVDQFLYRNALEGLFLHELTHAISLSSKGPFFRVLHAIFGAWASVIPLNAPKFMVEGVTVSFESLDGTGRARDPLVRGKLRQAAHEGRFLSPYQASGVYDLPPAGNAYYEYGGLFSAYLQQQYGMEKYAELWQAMGRSYHGSLFFYNTGFYHIFKEIYGLPLLEAWDAFEESLTITGLEENEGGFVAGGAAPGARKEGLLPGGKALLYDTGSRGGQVFFLDRISGKVYTLDPATGRFAPVTRVDASAYALDIAPGGDRMLVSSYHYTGGLARAVVTEYDVRRGGKTGRVWKGLYNGSYFRDGLIGLSSTRHSNNLVFRNAQGGEEPLLRGSAELLYADPRALDDTRIALIAAVQGQRQLWIYDYETREAAVLESDLADDAQRWQYIRNLRVSQGRLFFSFNHDDRIYKLGMAVLSPEAALVEETPAADALEEAPAEEAAPAEGSPAEEAAPDRGGPLGEVVFAEREFSGGVFLPVLAGSEIYYRGAFSTWDALMKYPETLEALTGVRAVLRLRPLAASVLAQARPAGPPATPLGEPRESKGYFPLKYLNPLGFWLPLPLMDMDSGAFTGFGLVSFLSDPTDHNIINLQLYMDIARLMAPVSIQWTSLSLGFPVDVSFNDALYTGGKPYYRETNGTLSARLSQGLGGDLHHLFVQPGFSFGLYSYDPGSGETPYAWTFDDPAYNLVLGLGYSSLSRYYWDLFGRGVYLSAAASYLLPQQSPRLEGLFQAALEPYLPFKAVLYGAWDANPMDMLGNSPQHGSALFAEFSSPEYGGGLRNLPWVSGGELRLKLFSLEIQHGRLFHLYFNRFFGALAYRGVFYDDQGVEDAAGNLLSGRFRLAQSLELSLGLTSSTAIIALQPAKLSLTLMGVWKISNMNDGLNNDFWFGPRFTLEM
jgi:hypothetical protein